MVPKKQESKRKSTRLRTKINRKVREHHRKIRKESKNSVKKRKSKEPGIPNSLPFKEQLLTELRDNRAKESFKGLTEGERYAQLSTVAEEREKDFNVVVEGSTEKEAIKDNSKKVFYREFQKVVEGADVIVQVLDARDPLGCRESTVEQLVQEKGKKLVLLLNKIDLVPRENASNWVKYLRREYPTIPFKASTQSQRRHLSQATHHHSAEKETDLNGDCCYGAEDVMNILKNYSRSQNIKTAITVGVVGLPNVGKSSFINSLKRSKACQVGSMPGMTRVVQEVVLDKNIKLLDSPGIVFTNSSDSLLRNAVRVDQIEDLFGVVECIMNKTNVPLLTRVYNLQKEFGENDVTTFLTLVAQSCGKLRAGGVLDLDSAARLIINDWNSAKIPYYSLPPLQPDDKSFDDACILNQLSEPFQLDLPNNIDMEIDQ